MRTGDDRSLGKQGVERNLAKNITMQILMKKSAQVHVMDFKDALLQLFSKKNFLRKTVQKSVNV